MKMGEIHAAVDWCGVKLISEDGAMSVVVASLPILSV
jgi:hypothetical protein